MIWPSPMRYWLFLALLGAVPSLAGEAVYRWADDRGGVHYTDQPPTDRHSVILPKVAKAPQSKVIVNDGKSVEVPNHRAKACADARQQLAYLDSRAVAKPVDDPNRAISRELDKNYQGDLAAYEIFQTTRNAHLGLIAENCDR